MSTTAILGGRLVLPGGVETGGLLLRDGLIAAVGRFEAPADAERIDARRRLIAPGVIDVGVFATDRAASAAGGITAALLMPTARHPLDAAPLVKHASGLGGDGLAIHPIAGATQGLAGAHLGEIGLAARAGAKAVATGRGWIGDAGLMRHLLGYAGSLGLVTIVHAEDAGLAAGAVATESETATRMGLPAAPAIAEALAVARDLMLAEETGAAIHFRQVTTGRALDLIRQAKAKGLPVTCGITPAHLLLSEIAISGFRTFARLSPPLRSEADRLACREAVADGTIDILCSGHDPRGPEAKRLPFADAEPGMAGAATLLTLGLTLVRDGLIDEARLFAMLAANPARRFGLPGGRIEVGAPADLILVDPEAPWIVDAARLPGLAGNTPFDGLPVQGRVAQCWRGGKTVA